VTSHETAGGEQSPVVTAIHIAPASRLPMRAVESPGLIVSVRHGTGAAARASAPEVPVERGADREPGSGEALARLAGGQVELEDGPAERLPFDVDECD
jgi:hypothetical protein